MVQMRNVGDAASTRVRVSCAASKEAAQAREDVARFRIPGGSMVDPSRPLACDAWLARGSDLLVEWRAFSTWRAYATHITVAIAWLREQVEASHMKWHANTLRKEPRFFSAFAVYKLKTAETLKAVKKPIQALHMAMRINNIPV